MAVPMVSYILIDSGCIAAEHSGYKIRDILGSEDVHDQLAVKLPTPSSFKAASK